LGATSGFKDGQRHGQGKLTYPDGRKFVGEWKDGEPIGQGTYIYGKGKWEGDMYEGEFKDGKKHGQGTYTISSGGKYIGEWKDGERWNGTLYDKEGKIIGKFMNGWFDQ
jgi:hypothetical protein